MRGPNDKRFGPRFPDMTAVYEKEFQEIVVEESNAIARERFDSGRDRELTDFLHRGTYCALSGPTYETPAEIQMVKRMGGHLVGMSTVPEAIAARHMGAEVLGISLVTNLAAGISALPLSHEEVKETAAAARERFTTLIDGLLRELAG